MARVTVEDCLKVISNPFELVVLSAQRAREITQGAPINVSRDNDRDTVVALREVAAGAFDRDTMIANTIDRIKKNPSERAPDDEVSEAALEERKRLVASDVENDIEAMRQGFHEEDEETSDTDEEEI